MVVCNRDISRNMDGVFTGAVSRHFIECAKIRAPVHYGRLCWRHPMKPEGPPRVRGANDD